MSDTPDTADSRLEQATSWFRRVHSESASVEELAELKRWLESDPGNQLAYQQVAQTWGALAAMSSAPEILMGRRNALDTARRAARRRWAVPVGGSRVAALAASIVAVVIAVGGWLYTQKGVYTTGLGERRSLTLEDGSAVTLDARSKVRVKYDDGERLIELVQGQARFDVASDPTRPFRVRAGEQMVIALGTQFNVELVAGNVLVSLIEGRVAVTGVKSTGAPVEVIEAAASRNDAGPARERPLKRSGKAVELNAGEGMRIERDGEAFVLAKIDLHRATAWQSGKMFFDNEPLLNAAERMNRYSSAQIEVDPAVANVGVSGVFNAGDANAFVEAISNYFPVKVETAGSQIRLTRRD